MFNQISAILKEKFVFHSVYHFRVKNKCLRWFSSLLGLYYSTIRNPSPHRGNFTFAMSILSWDNFPANLIFQAISCRIKKRKLSFTCAKWISPHSATVWNECWVRIWKGFWKSVFAITNQQRALLNGVPRYLSVFRPSHASSNSVNYHCARPIVRGVQKKIEADKNDRRFDAYSSNMAANVRAIALSIAAALWGSRYRHPTFCTTKVYRILSPPSNCEIDLRILNMLYRHVSVLPVTSANPDFHVDVPFNGHFPTDFIMEEHTKIDQFSFEG